MKQNEAIHVISIGQKPATVSSRDFIPAPLPDQQPGDPDVPPAGGEATDCERRASHERSAAYVRDAFVVLEGLQEGVLVQDTGRVIGANHALVRISGRRYQDLVGASIEQLFADPDGQPLEDWRASDAVRLRAADGELVPVSLRPLSESICLVIDRSRERRLEQEVWRLAQAEDTVAPTAFCSEAANSIEHELGTAATVIRGNLRMLQSGRIGELNEKQGELLEAAQRETERVADLSMKLMQLALPGADSALSLVRKPVRVTELVEGAVTRCRALFEERGMGLTAEFDHEVDSLSLDVDRIEQVLHNLLQNALKFAPAQSQVRLAVDQVELNDSEAGPRAELCISVLDQGPGVSAEEAARIFEPFARGAATRQRSVPGVGLGLAVAQQIAMAHGGRIEAVPEAEGGHFRLVLPLAGARGS